MELTLMKNTTKTILSLIGIALIAYSAYVLYGYVKPGFYLHGESMSPTILPDKVYSGRRIWGFQAIERNRVVAISPELLSDIDVKHPPGFYIKRMVGLPGDTLEFSKSEGNLLAINGVPVRLTPTDKVKSYFLRSKRADTYGEQISGVPYEYHDQYGGAHYVYESTRNPKSSTKGSKALIFADVIFDMPFLDKLPSQNGNVFVDIPDGYYFALSDNRTVGTDSRHYGLVPRASIKAYIDI
ncbi:signal peptidase I [Alteromonas sp. 14N.309.X.WAT.G.H12]|uniref:signal peptidase I n=1 Tax=Alteromonas sp. 14N.309.X.WAT.G.H12 TaxID=3120824 RepID=UPI002FD16B76